MKIYLSANTAGKYGGGLNSSLRFVPDIIQAELDDINFQSSFDEIWLTIAYPPMYVLPRVVGIEKGFKTYFEELPVIRINRKYKKIDVTVKASEFSEHFDLKNKAEYEHTFEIEDRYTNIPEIELAKILIDKYTAAGELINTKLKSGDIFEIEIYKTALFALTNKITPDFLTKESEKQQKKLKDETLNRAIALREQRRQAITIKDKRIRDLRVYDSGLPKKALYPFAYQYTEIFLNILKRNQLMCPTYNHIYIQVAKTFEECLTESYAVENWYANGLAVIDYDNYLKQNDNRKEKIIFELIVTGLKDIAEIDKLDMSIIDKTIEEIRVKGLDTELEHLSVENKKYKLVITYLSRSMEEQCPIFFNITDKSSGKSKRVQIGREDNSNVYLWLQKVTLSNNTIKVKSSASVAADVYLKGKDRNMEFDIEKMLNE